MQNDISRVLADKSNGDEAKDEECPADGDEASDTKPESTSAMPSDAQRLRLTQQAMVTVEMLQRLYDRDYLLQKMEEALGIIDAEKTDKSKTKIQTLKDVKEISKEAQLISSDNTLEIVAKKVVDDFGVEKQASTILSWYREFLRLDGRFRVDCRDVFERVDIV